MKKIKNSIQFLHTIININNINKKKPYNTFNNLNFQVKLLKQINCNICKIT